MTSTTKTAMPIFPVLARAARVGTGALGGYMLMNDGAAAIKDFSQGNIGSGLSNLGVAALGGGALTSSLGKAIKGSRLMQRGRSLQGAQNYLKRHGREDSTLLKYLHPAISRADRNPYMGKALSGISRVEGLPLFRYLNNPRKGQGFGSVMSNLGLYGGLGMTGDALRKPGTLNPYTNELVPYTHNPYRRLPGYAV